VLAGSHIVKMNKGLLALLVCLTIGGCSSGPEKSPEEVKLLTEQNNIVTNAYREGRGFDQLTADEKQRFMKGFDGDEAKAKASFDKAAKGVAYFFGGGQQANPKPQTK